MHRKDVFLAISSFALTFAIFSIFAPLRIEAHHDGLMLKTALDVYSGQHLFRDTFTQYGALTVYIQAAALSLLGPTLLSLKLVTVFFYSLNAAIQYLCWRLLLPRSLAILSIGFWIVLAPFYEAEWILLPWSSVYALTFQSLGLLCLGFSVRYPLKIKHQLTLAFFCGVFAGLASWCRTPVGILLLIAAFISIAWVQYTRHVGQAPANKALGLAFKPTFAQAVAITSALAVTLISGFGLVWLLFLANIVRNQATSDWIFQVFTFPRMWMERSPVTFDRVWSDLLINPRAAATLIGFLIVGARALQKRSVTLVFAWWVAFLLLTWQRPNIANVTDGFASALPILVLCLIAFEAVRTFRALRAPQTTDLTSPTAIALGVGAIASWSQYYPVHCVRHVYWGISPAIGLAIFALYQISQKKPRWVAVAVIGCLTPLLINRVFQIQETLATPYVAITEAPVLAGMKAPPEEAAWMNKLGAELKKHFEKSGPRPILLESPDAMIAAWTPNLKNPNALYVDWDFKRPDLKNTRDLFIQNEHPYIVVSHASKTVTENYLKSGMYQKLSGDFPYDVLTPKIYSPVSSN